MNYLSPEHYRAEPWPERGSYDLIMAGGGGGCDGDGGCGDGQSGSVGCGH